MATLGSWEKSKVHQTALKVEKLEDAAATSLHYGATSNDLANFPGMMNLVAGSGVSFTPGTGTLTITATGGGGTVTSVGMSVPSFLSVSGSPVTTSGTLAVTYSGTALPIANGGSGQTTANAALNAFLPSQATHSGKVLQTDGTNTSWQTNGSGTVTSVAVSVNNGISVSGSPITTSGTFTLGLGAITPTSVSTGNLTASGTVSLPNASITDAMLRNSAGLSVIGRPAASSGAPSDIVSTGARTFLASSAANTAVTFRAIETADLPTGNWIGANSGTGYAPSFTSISSDATWFDSGASITITAGTYLLSYSLRASMAITAGAGLISGRLYNVTDAAAVTNSEVMAVSSNIAGTTQGTGTASAVLTVAGTKTIRLEAQRDAGASYTGAATRTKSDAGGRTSISYVRIA